MNDARFAFGQNWRSFLQTLDEERIDQATVSMIELLGLPACQPNASSTLLTGQSFLDIGSGSGLFSLVAHRLGANVVSIDYDEQSVACTQHLRTRYTHDSPRWTIHQGSVLDESFMRSLGQFDWVYSWGVLHHTGELKRALQVATQRVTDNGGRLAIAIYNDQGGASRRWLAIKKFYHALPTPFRPVWVIVIAAYYEFKFALARLARFRNPLPFADWRRKKMDRGMSAWHDWVDWIGGLPFEVARPEAIIVPLFQQGFHLQNLRTVGSGWGCNEYVFQRTAKSEDSSSKDRS